MLTVLSFCRKDADQTERLAHWIAELGGCKGHELLLGIDSAVSEPDGRKVQLLLEQSFDKVTVLPIANPYNDDEHAWPRAANHAFSTLARHIDENNLAPYWLYIEPDAVPLSAGCINAIEKVHIESKKQFTGAYVRGANGSADKMSGIGIYPGNLVQYAGIALIADEVAFDQAAASQIVPLANFTSLIFHKWKGLSFSSIEELREMIGPEPVVYHSDKTGKTIELLRAGKELWQRRSGTENTGGTDENKITTGLESRSPNEDAKIAERQTRDASTSTMSVEKQDASVISCAKAEQDSNPKSLYVSSSVPTVTGKGIGLNSAPPAQNPSGPDLIRPVSAIIPWRDKAETIACIDSLAKQLKPFCTSPHTTRITRERLKQAGVIKIVKAR